MDWCRARSLQGLYFQRNCAVLKQSIRRGIAWIPKSWGIRTRQWIHSLVSSCSQKKSGEGYWSDIRAGKIYYIRQEKFTHLLLPWEIILQSTTGLESRIKLSQGHWIKCWVLSSIHWTWHYVQIKMEIKRINRVP